MNNHYSENRIVTDVNSMATEQGKTMSEIADEYFGLLQDEEKIKETIKGLRDDIIRKLSESNRDSYGIAEHDSPLKITYVMGKTRETMKKGGKDRLREILTSTQWVEIYNPPGEAPKLTVSRKDKARKRNE